MTEFLGHGVRGEVRSSNRHDPPLHGARGKVTTSNRHVLPELRGARGETGVSNRHGSSQHGVRGEVTTSNRHDPSDLRGVRGGTTVPNRHDMAHSQTDDDARGETPVSNRRPVTHSAEHILFDCPLQLLLKLAPTSYKARPLTTYFIPLKVPGNWPPFSSIATAFSALSPNAPIRLD